MTGSAGRSETRREEGGRGSGGTKKQRVLNTWDEGEEIRRRGKEEKRRGGVEERR